jgi:hypothetical protein
VSVLRLVRFLRSPTEPDVPVPSIRLSTVHADVSGLSLAADHGDAMLAR